ncbi:MAG: M56 family metallopeptidase [Saprospiraceae bacterium]|nr:M56 family metallopeptidase [Saprospiraceae bacterium]MBP7801236.1 M56 family metallopeptidase [Saprospiraceae bacterium]MBP7921736.1 M56 family metallopeptidase [Saprospiraceae bacterium]MBP8094089.1 M56 family metallopeptidase [Saprospiraceae bacterium]MBP8940700.1 M56 family metallopeptidase [Saprospiraceae bacterium]
MILSSLSQQQDLLQAWVWAMIHSAWIGITLAGLYFLYLNYFPRSRPSVKYKVGLSLFMLLPIGSLIAFILHLPSVSNAPVLATADPNPSGVTEAWSTISSKAPSLASQIPFFQGIEMYIPSLFGVWCLGVIILSIRMSLGYREVYRLRSMSNPIPVPGINQLFDRLIVKSGVKQNIRLATSHLIDMPATIGYLKPIILLPVSLINQLSTEEAYAILAHELAHIIRKDYLQNILISMTEILFFFHPSVWWFSTTIKSLREQCCDDLALELGAEPMALSKALVQLEEHAPAPLFAMAFSHKKQLFYRIQRLFNMQTKNEYSISRTQAPMLICSLALIWILSNLWTPIIANNVKIPLAKSFVWEVPTKTVAVAPSDTTKPKSKIEKISKDNGKQKIELQLKDKEITELKVDDKIIPPAEYNKYAEEMESLKKELKEIDMPTRVKDKPRDFEPRDYEYNFAPRVFNFGENRIKSDIDEMHVKVQPKVRIKSGAGGNTFYFDDGRDGPKIYGLGRGMFPGRDNDPINWVIEGDSSYLKIAGDKLIIKDEHGDVIIDFNDDFRGLGNNLYGLDHLKGLKSLRDISELKKLYSEDMMNKLERAKMLDNDRLLWSKEKSDKYMEHSRKLLDDAQSHQKELLDKMQWKLADDMDARKFFKDGQGFNLLSGKGKLDQIIQDKLVDDHIIKSGDKYEFKINEKDLRINGKKQDQKTYNEFKALIEEKTGFELKENTSFTFSGSGKKD